jgi:betaine-aldehyde dehydrogenase
VVFDDADLDAAIRGAVAASLINSGQDCTAATRAYVQRSLFDQFVEGVADLMSKVRVGAPTDPRTDQGPLVSHAQRDRVAAMVGRAINDRAKAVT